MIRTLLNQISQNEMKEVTELIVAGFHILNSKILLNTPPSDL